jgi:hypothetical protein
MIKRKGTIKKDTVVDEKQLIKVKESKLSLGLIQY